MVQIGGHKEDKSMCTFKIFFKQAYKGFSFIWHTRQQGVYPFYLHEVGKIF